MIKLNQAVKVDQPIANSGIPVIEERPQGQYPDER
jgi:hypothetical protein